MISGNSPVPFPHARLDTLQQSGVEIIKICSKCELHVFQSGGNVLASVFFRVWNYIISMI